MIGTSEAYNPYTDNRRIGLKFIFGVIAPEAAAQAVPTSSEQAEISQISQSHDDVQKMSLRIGSLEDNLFILDGTYSVSPDEIENIQTGWWSADLSDIEGAFSSNPWIEFEFPKSHRSYGFTLIFDDTIPGDYPSEVTVTSYDSSGDIIGTITVNPDSFKCVIPLPSIGYRKLKIEFSKTNKPFRRIRLCEVRFGVDYTYDKNSIGSATLNLSADPASESLPTNEFVAKIDNSNKLYNMINPEGLFAFLQDGQFAKCFISIDVEEIDMGRFYFTSAQSEDGGLTADITFNDRILMLDNVIYNSGASGTWTLSDAVASILNVAGFEIETKYNGMDGTVIRKCIPENTTCREALRLACQAAMCSCYINRDYVLEFFSPVAGEPMDNITRDAQSKDAQISVEERYNVVMLTARDDFAGTTLTYTAKNIGEDESELVYQVDNPLVNDGNAVASWILAWKQRRVKYDLAYRGNPALDIFDTAKIFDIYGVNGNAVITQQRYSYNGGLEADAKAIKWGD